MMTGQCILLMKVKHELTSGFWSLCLLQLPCLFSQASLLSRVLNWVWVSSALHTVFVFCFSHLKGSPTSLPPSLELSGVWEFVLCFHGVFLPIYTSLFLQPRTMELLLSMGALVRKATDRNIAIKGNEHQVLLLKPSLRPWIQCVKQAYIYVMLFPLLPENYFLKKIVTSLRDWFGFCIVYTARQGCKVEALA